MKALFLTFHGFDAANGISKKIHYQVRALEANGLETYLCYLSEEHGRKQRMAGKQVIADYGTGWRSKISKRIEFDSIVRFVVREKIKLVYMRSAHNANPFTIRLVRRLKQEGCRVIMEIPTYPYDQEYVTFRMKIGLYLDRYYRKKLARCLDGIVTFSDYKTIFGVPTIQISNGIDFEAIPLKHALNTPERELHLIGVAEIHYWHGYDRLIKGMAEYYATRPDYKVYFHLIGDFFSARERNEIVPLIGQSGLGPYVILHGALHGKALDNLFDRCDMGIGSLGRHRSGIQHIKTLKNREYAARGIPFIYSETDTDFENRPYILKVPANEAPVNIGRLIAFYQQLSVSPSGIRASIQELSWERQIKKVLERIF